MTDTWAEMTRGFLERTTAVNRAAMSAMFPLAGGASMFPSADGGLELETEGDVPPSVPSVDYEHLDWAFERTVDDPDHISVGDVVTFEKAISEDDVEAFARASGDTNRLHLDDAFAADSRFGERIVHGTLVSGLISAALARLPGLTIYLSQDLEFSGPVKIGDRVSARVEIVEDLGHGQYRLETVVRDEDEDAEVIDGEAVVLIDDMPDQ